MNVKYWVHLFILILGVIFPTLLSAQEVYTYSGKYPFSWKVMPFSSDGMNIFKQDIEATYQYILDEETDERIYQGSFSGVGSFNLRQNDGSIRKVSVNISGSFNNDLQDGKWEYTYIYKDCAIKCILNFDKGLLNGTQTFEWTEKGEFFKLTETLKNGVYTGDISGNGSKGLKVDFHFNENGLPTGNWVLSKDDSTHKLSFDETGKVIKARTIDTRNGNVQNWDISGNLDGDDVTLRTINQILHLYNTYILPDNHFSLALLGGNHIEIANPIFSFTYPMRQSQGYAKNKFVTDIEKYKQSTNLKIETIVDEEAIFPGGTNALKQWLCDNGVNKKNWMSREGVTIDVYVDGTVHNVQIIKSSNPTISSDLKTAFSSESMPRWTPAKKNGKEVNSRLTLMLTKP